MSAEGDCSATDDGGKAEDAGECRAEAGDAKTQRNTCKMKAGGGDEEAEAEGQRTGRAEFAAMGMAVEEGEEADNGSRGGDRQTNGGCDQKPKANHGSEDRRLNEGQGDACDGQTETNRHHRHEGSGHGPQGAATDLACPDTDGNHGQDVVGAEERVGDAGHQGSVCCRIKVSKGGRCGCCKQSGGE